MLDDWRYEPYTQEQTAALARYDSALLNSLEAKLVAALKAEDPKAVVSPDGDRTTIDGHFDLRFVLIQLLDRLEESKE
jgi:hypothetical protein